MLIIEGPDCVGKTTLAHTLNKGLADLGYVYSHFTRLPYGFDRYWGYIERMSRRIVQDRFHLSEIVYAEARGDVSPLTPEMYNLVDARLRMLGGFTVLITADEELLRKRFSPHNQMFDLTRTLLTAEKYRHLDTEFPRYKIDIDYRIDCLEKGGFHFATEYHINEILKRYRNRQLLINQLAQRRPYSIHENT